MKTYKIEFKVKGNKQCRVFTDFSDMYTFSKTLRANNINYVMFSL